MNYNSTLSTFPKVEPNLRATAIVWIASSRENIPIKPQGIGMFSRELAGGYVLSEARDWLLVWLHLSKGG